MPTEEDVRRWIREEQAAITAEKQLACEHMWAGTLHADGTVTCNQCEKLLTKDDWDRNSGTTYGFAASKR